ncbi:MAG: HAMP domain-containing histidine kinase [Elusimicrobia bacterium]|nr:HAMP domain-containing histidine kinase [Elusimicrobiota bacterium]
MSHRVLVVEDDLDIQGYCKTILESEGFTVDACDTAAEARRLFAANRPDLAVLDIGLPDGTGMDLMKEWHAYAGPKVPVLFLTARGDLKTRLECFQAGAVDYVHKPFAAEEMLARAKVHLQVKKSHEELVKRNYELELVARARQDMTDMIVHDLKAPLTAIKGTLELIHSRGLISQDNYSLLLSNAGTAADFMLLMLNDMLDLAQAKEKGLKTEITFLDPALLLRKIENLFSGRMRLNGATVAMRVAPGVEKVRADQNLLFRILANLITNAMKAAPGAHPVEVDCGYNGVSARFIVSDRGPGVPDNQKTRIFEKYVTSGRKDSPMDTGTGIGLSFCAAAVSAHKGKIWVEDRPGGGSRFIFDLPQAD